MNRSKKQKIFEEPHWECSVCTYQNKAEAFKCSMCNVRKGTSTRKPKVNLQLATQSTSQFNSASSKSNRKDENLKDRADSRKNKKFKRTWKPSKLRNVDRNSAQARDVTINNLTISITEYKIKEKRYDPLDPSSTSEMSSPSESGFDTSSTVATHSSRNSHSL